MGAVQKQTQSAIVGLFQRKQELEFSEIQRAVDVRSNALAYHLKELRKQGVLEKKDECYRLSLQAESKIPYGEKPAKLAVVVLAIRNTKGQFALIKREKRPYQGYWALPGGKVAMDESLGDAAKRIAWDEAGIIFENPRTHAVVDEHLLEEGSVKNSWLLFVMSAKVKEGGKNAHWVGKEKLEHVKVIPSDQWMLSLLKKTMRVHQVKMESANGYQQISAT